jgi:hypothetical protein
MDSTEMTTFMELIVYPRCTINSTVGYISKKYLHETEVSVLYNPQNIVCAQPAGRMKALRRLLNRKIKKASSKSPRQGADDFTSLGRENRQIAFEADEGSR